MKAFRGSRGSSGRKRRLDLQMSSLPVYFARNPLPPAKPGKRIEGVIVIPIEWKSRFGFRSFGFRSLPFLRDVLPVDPSFLRACPDVPEVGVIGAGALRLG